MRRILTNELSNYFEYKVSIIAVKSPCWKLIAYPGARSLLKQNNLISNDSEAIEHVQFKCFQQPISVLINALYADNQTQIFIDKTRIKGNVSLQLDCFMGNINEANKALKKYGLSLIKGSIKARGLRIVKR